jgi:protein-tyrosine phosphatase
MRDAIDFRRLQEAGIEAILQLYGAPRERIHFPIPVALLQLPVPDREPLDLDLLNEGVAFIRAQRAAGRLILVACGAGVSRSATFAAAYLHEEGLELLEALRQVLHGRPEARPHPELLRSLVERYHPSLSAEVLILALNRERQDLYPERRARGG